MKRLSIRDTLEFGNGRMFEMEFARYLIIRGFEVDRCYDFEHRNAPMLEGEFASYRLPDLLANRPGKSRWWECKEKRNCTYTHSLDRDEEGIDHDCWRDYCRVQEISGVPVWLAFAEWKKQRILGQSLNRLGPPRIVPPHIAKYGKGGMVYWPCEQFVVLGGYDPKTGQLDLPFGPARKTRAA